MIRLLICFSFCLFVLQSCSPIGAATGAGAVVGIKSAQEGGLKAAATDTKIKLTINDLWFKYDLEAFAKLNLTVNQGRVLLTGIVQEPEHRVEAVRLAWQPEGVRQVINEIQINEDGVGVVDYAKDSWIIGELRAKMIFDKQIQSVNFTIDVVKGVVYLMGVAQNQAELNRVIETARTVPYVRQVISYVKILGEPLTTVQP